MSGPGPEPGGPSPAVQGVEDARGRWLRDLRISVTDRCNFRCPYCMPAEVFGEAYHFLPKPEILSFEEIERLCGVFLKLGVRKLRITGGEPLLRADLAGLIERLAALPGAEDLALTTNGSLLASRAEGLAKAGLSRVTVSLDSLDESTFRRLNGRDVALARVLDGIEAASRAGLRPIKINTVVIAGVNDGEIETLARRFRGTGHVLRFIEFMDVGTRNGWRRDRVVPAAQVLERIDRLFPLEPVAPEVPGQVARRYRYRDGSGEIGLIASVTQPFCGGCTRARLSAEGRLFTCLFATEGTDLKTALRKGASDAELRDLVLGTWRARTDRYSEERTAATPEDASARVEMYHIGG